tara:strand:- start:5779 stop:6303 length:525 start_codon:yes stop_codon:yes gene_type:complete
MYYCPPPLESIIVHCITEDEMTYTTGDYESATRKVSFEYADNRYFATHELSMFGTACIKNNSQETRAVRYRQAVPIKFGYVGPNNSDNYVCVENNEAVVVWEVILEPAEIVDFELSWSLPIYAISDYNQDGFVDGGDLGTFLSDWNTTKERSDFNYDGTVNGIDLGFLLGQWSS